MKTILICNAGSTSLKFKLFCFPQKAVLFESRIERIGDGQGTFTWKNTVTNAEGSECLSIAGYREGIELFLSALTGGAGAIASVRELDAVGFKTVIAKGFYGVHLLDDAVLEGMREYLDIAPAHNRAYLDAIALFRELVPDVPLVGVFETAFHTTIGEEKTCYPLPYEWREQYGLRRFGYHGASHAYIAQKIAERCGGKQRLVSLHLGGSSSACAVYDGKSVDTSFGFSLQTGIPHADRSGDTDPFVIPFLIRRGMTMEEITRQMTKNSGLRGISGISGDFRDLEAEYRKGNARAELALQVFAYSVSKYVGAFYTQLNGMDHLVFTGGIGEHSALARTMICERLGALGVVLSKEKNSAVSAGERLISDDRSEVKIWVLPTNEEIVVAEKTYRCLYGNNM